MSTGECRVLFPHGNLGTEPDGSPNPLSGTIRLFGWPEDVCLPPPASLALAPSELAMRLNEPFLFRRLLVSNLEKAQFVGSIR